MMRACRSGIMRCVGRGMMTDRVKAFHTANIFEPHRYNHIVGYPTMSYEQVDQLRNGAFEFSGYSHHGDWPDRSVCCRRVFLDVIEEECRLAQV